MDKLIISVLAASAAFAGIMGTQLTRPAEAASDQVTTPANVRQYNGQKNSDLGNLTVIELFTSQGCSSCPPADLLASRLAKDSSLLVISRPVTYWDRLGWKDTLARPENTELQRAYAGKDNAGSGVYTPQMVVNGGDGAVGSREFDIRSLVRRANKQGPSISVVKSDDGGVTVNISGKSRHMASVSLLALSASETIKVGRGENGGRTLHYTNVVKAERSLGSWVGKPLSITIPPENLTITGANRYAVILQRPGAGAIIGAKLLDM